MFLKTENKVPSSPTFIHSIRFRLTLFIILITASSFFSLMFYVIHQFETLTEIELRHEGMVLANSLESGMLTYFDRRNIAGMQNYIDSLVRIREKNDIEINVMLLDGEKSAIVASNIPDNIEETSKDEHQNLIKSLQYGQPVFMIGREDADDLSKKLPAPSNPDHYFPSGYRFISITNPLMMDGRGIGSINLKLSLAFLDRELKEINRWNLIFISVVMLVLLFTIGFFINYMVFRPLLKISEKMYSVGSSKVDLEPVLPTWRNEIGIFAKSFNMMQQRITNLIEGMRGSLDIVAHDLKTPLARLRANIEMALQEERDAESLRETLQDCAEESERIVTMLNTLMDISEAETGVMRLTYEQVSVNALIMEIIELYEYPAENRNIVISTDIPKDIHVSADRNRLRQVMANLVDNAVKYTPQGGGIHITGKYRKHEIFICVEDTGNGIAREDLPRVFDRLYRADKSRSQKGIGLGLSMVKAIIIAHKGHVKVENVPTKGARFCLTLPSDDSGVP